MSTEQSIEYIPAVGDVVMVEQCESGVKWMAEIHHIAKGGRVHARWIKRERGAMAMSKVRGLKPGKERILRKCAPFEAHEFRRMAKDLTS